MRDSQDLGGRSRGFGFIGRIARSTHGEGSHVGVQLGQRPAHQRGIDSAAQQGGNGDIRNQPQASAFDNAFFGFFQRFFERDLGSFAVFRQIPIAAGGDAGSPRSTPR